MNVSISVVSDKTIVLNKPLADAKGGKSVRVKAIKGGQYLLAENGSGVGPENITVKRVGKNLHVALEGSDLDHPELIIEDFFGSGGQLIGQAEDGLYHEYIAADGDGDSAAAFLMDGMSSPLVLGSPQLAGFGEGLAVADANGNWGFTPTTPLSNGAHDFTVTAQDAAGNESLASDVFGIVVDTIPPAAPVIETVFDDAGAKTGNLVQGEMTDDTIPTISGRAEAGSTVVIKDKGVKIGSVVAGNDGKWTFEPSAALAAGGHEFTAEAIDAAGNVSAASDSFEIIVDSVPPTTPRISNLTDDFGQHQGLVMNGSVTDDTKPELGGTGKAGETIEVRIDDVAVGRTVVNANGRWSFTPENALADGHYVFTAVAISAGGAESPKSNSFRVEVDTVAPDRPLIENVEDDMGSWQGSLTNGQVTDDRTPIFSGKAEPGSFIMVLDNGEDAGDTPVDEDGNWTFQSKVLSYGEHVFTFYALDPAGNWSKESAPWTVIVALNGRSLEKGGEADAALTVQDVLADVHAEVVGEPRDSVHASEEPERELRIESGNEGELQDSWAGSGACVESGVEWMTANPLQTAYAFEQQLTV